MATDTAPKHSGVYPALLQAQKDMGPVLKNSTNPAFKSKYADLAAIIETVSGPFQDNDLVLTQPIGVNESGETCVMTRLVHAPTGEVITSEAPIISKDPNDPQKFGGAVTYMRRYSILALVGLAPEDDDGNHASQAAPVVPDDAELKTLLKAAGCKTANDANVRSQADMKKHINSLTAADLKKWKEMLAASPGGPNF